MSYSVQDFLQVLAGDSHSSQALGGAQVRKNLEKIGVLEAGKAVRFSKYFDLYTGDWGTNSIAGGLIGTIVNEDTQRADHYIVHLGDGTPVSVHKQNMSPFKVD
jgi:hypothetical protein